MLKSFLVHPMKLSAILAVCVAPAPAAPPAPAPPPTSAVFTGSAIRFTWPLGQALPKIAFTPRQRFLKEGMLAEAHAPCPTTSPQGAVGGAFSTSVLNIHLLAHAHTVLLALMRGSARS